MGNFDAGKTATWMLIYFFAIFVIFTGIGKVAAHYGINNDIRYDSSGFDNLQSNNINSTSSNVDDTQNYGFGVRDTFNFLFGFKDSVSLGISNEFAWIFRFIFVYLPSLILLISLYFMLPFVR